MLRTTTYHLRRLESVQVRVLRTVHHATLAVLIHVIVAVRVLRVHPLELTDGRQ